MTPNAPTAQIARYESYGYDHGMRPAHNGEWVRYCDAFPAPTVPPGVDRLDAAREAIEQQSFGSQATDEILRLIHKNQSPPHYQITEVILKAAAKINAAKQPTADAGAASEGADDTIVRELRMAAKDMRNTLRVETKLFGQWAHAQAKFMDRMADKVEQAAQRPTHPPKAEQTATEPVGAEALLHEARQYLGCLEYRGETPEYREVVSWPHPEVVFSWIRRYDAAQPAPVRAEALDEYHIETFRHAGNVIFNKANEASSCSGKEQGRQALRTIQQVADLIVHSPAGASPLHPAASAPAQSAEPDAKNSEQFAKNSGEFAKRDAGDEEFVRELERKLRASGMAHEFSPETIAVGAARDAITYAREAERRRCAKQFKEAVEALKAEIIIQRDKAFLAQQHGHGRGLAEAEEMVAALLQSEFGEGKQ